MKKINFKNSLWITVAIMALVILSTDVMAQRGRRNANKPGMGQGMMQDQRGFEPGQRCVKMLDLTEAQQEQMKALRIKHMEQMLPMRNQRQEQRAKLQTLRTAKNVDMKAINSLIDDMADLQANKMKASEAHRQEMRSVLTDEQRVIFDSLKGKRNGNKGQAQGNRQGKRGQGASRGMGR